MVNLLEIVNTYAVFKAVLSKMKNMSGVGEVCNKVRHLLALI